MLSRPMFRAGPGCYQHNLGSDHPELPGVPALRLHPVHLELPDPAGGSHLPVGNLLASDD